MLKTLTDICSLRIKPFLYSFNSVEIYRMLNKPSYICALGLSVFLYRFYSKRSVVSLIVFCNGIIFHVFLPKNIFMKWIDIIFNLGVVVYLNILEKNCKPFMWSVTAFIIFPLNGQIFLVYPMLSSIIHVLGVQGFLFKALSYTNY